MKSRRERKTTLRVFAAMLSFAVAAFLIAGCGGGGGRSSARDITASTPLTLSNPEALTSNPEALPTEPADCASGTVSINWTDPFCGCDDFDLLIDYGGQDIRRQIEVRGLSAGLTGVMAAPFDGITSTATGSTLVANQLPPNPDKTKIYTLSTVPMVGGTDHGGVYYRAWIYFPPFAESVLNTDTTNRLDLFAKITWPGGTYKARCNAERLTLWHTACYGPSYYDKGCVH